MTVRTLSGNRLGLAAIALAAVWCGACASTGAVPRPFPMPGGAPAAAPEQPVPPAPSRPAPLFPSSPNAAPASVAPSATAGVDGYALAGTALALRGTPYRNGGTDTNGFDCSGFTQYVFSQYGLSLPREVREQFRVGQPIRAEELAPGDILFFATTDPGPSHVAIAVGGDQFVHAPSSTGVVRVEHLSSSYWSPRYLGARRITN
jgi:cell wall-associated NlpC family hydrolase